MRLEILATMSNQTLQATAEDAKQRIMSAVDCDYIEKQIQLIEKCHLILLGRKEAAK